MLTLTIHFLPRGQGVVAVPKKGYHEYYSSE
jgi:hypothetical protein